MAELLRTDSLTKTFRGLVANSEIDFSLDVGEIRCIIGPNGAGKTTFISMISGHQAPTAGAIWFKGRNITGLPVYRIARLGILRKFQTPTVFDNLTVYENTELAVLATPTPPRERYAKILKTLELVRRSSAPCRTGSGNGSKSACCLRAMPSSCFSTSRPPA
jgi:ABC-type uncharacterized transport system ATPase subunit